MSEGLSLPWGDATRMGESARTLLRAALSPAASPAQVGAHAPGAAAPDAAMPGGLDGWLKAREPQVIAVCLSVLGNRADALDACQEVLLKAVAGLAGWRGEGPLDRWLLRIATRHCLDRLRRQRARPTEVPAGELAEEPPARTPPGLADAAELESVLRRVAERLTPRQRAAFVLRDLQGLELHEVAQAMECSAAAARSHLCSARKELRTILVREFPEFLDGMRRSDV